MEGTSLTATAVRGTIEETTEGESVTDFENARRVGGDSLAPAPGVYLTEGDVSDVNELVFALHNVDIDPSDLAELETFEQMFAALYAWKFKTMLAKQKDYGPENITKAGEKGIITRTQDKLERNKVLIGDEEQQIKRIKKLFSDAEPETLTEMNNFLNKLDEILYPEAQNESILDTWGDMGNYGDIGVTVHVGAWPKPLAS
jgi:hypothetical protein